jgi:hypothetical protein
VSLAAALLSQHIDGVVRAGSAGTKRAGRARAPLVLQLTMLAPERRRENRTVRGYQLLGSTTKRTRKSPTEVPPAAAFRVR